METHMNDCQYEAYLGRLLARIQRLKQEFDSCYEELSGQVNTDYAEEPEGFAGPWNYLPELERLLADVHAQNSARRGPDPRGRGPGGVSPLGARGLCGSGY